MDEGPGRHDSMRRNVSNTRVPRAYVGMTTATGTVPVNSSNLLFYRRPPNMIRLTALSLPRIAGSKDPRPDEDRTVDASENNSYASSFP